MGQILRSIRSVNGQNGSESMWNYCTGICRNILRKTTKPPSMTRCPTQFSNTKPPKYKPETRASVFSRAILHRPRLSMTHCLFSVRLVGWLVGWQAKHEDTEMSRRTYISHIQIILLFIDFFHTHFHEQNESDTFTA
jgi:hypothetical protein